MTGMGKNLDGRLPPWAECRHAVVVTLSWWSRARANVNTFLTIDTKQLNIGSHPLSGSRRADRGGRTDDGGPRIPAHYLLPLPMSIGNLNTPRGAETPA